MGFDFKELAFFNELEISVFRTLGYVNHYHFHLQVADCGECSPGSVCVQDCSVNETAPSASCMDVTGDTLGKRSTVRFFTTHC